ncbi:MAG: hypothetical protein II661_01515 [Bacteroidales bacterium]|nr:hypothetical protein [Bacteroidales bacterium]
MIALCATEPTNHIHKRLECISGKVCGAFSEQVYVEIICYRNSKMIHLVRYRIDEFRARRSRPYCNENR